MGLCQVEVKLKFWMCSRSRAFNCTNCIGASCYNCNNARTAHTDGSASELCADKDLKKKMYLTTTCERFISLVKPGVLVYNLL